MIDEYETTDNECEHYNVSWDSEPDFTGCHGMSMYWFGECEDCGTPVRERYSSQGVEEAD